jgi:hypothetical protein
MPEGTLFSSPRREKKQARKNGALQFKIATATDGVGVRQWLPRA